jgi:5-phospho-D-xylono-1,4-lactonase
MVEAREQQDGGRRSVGQLIESFVRDLIDGMDGTDVRAGAVKVGTSRNEVRAVEQRVIAAAARAHESTGCPITTHTTAGTAAMKQARSLVDLGVAPDVICVGHLVRRLVWEEHVALARLGVYLGYDCLGKEKYQPDERRIAFIRRLVDDGFAARICLGGDMARRSYLEAGGGGPGYRWILETFSPRLVEAGIPTEAVQSLLIDNPARHLAWR